MTATKTATKSKATAGMKITNPDVYKLGLAGMRACLDSIEHAMDEEGGVAQVSWEAIQRVYGELLAVQEHVVHGFPLPETR
jgi:hypothetical protein